MFNVINNHPKFVNSPKNFNRPKYCVEFGNATTKVVNSVENIANPFMSTREFAQKFDSIKPVLQARLPEPFLELFPMQSKKIFEFLDQFAQFCRPPCSNILYKDTALKINLSSGKSLTPVVLGQGGFGRALKIRPDANQKPFCFKAFFDTNLNLLDAEHLHGAVAENRTGLSLSGEEYNDIVTWHTGNTEDYKSWILTEFIDSTNSSQAERTGRSLNEARPDLNLGDGSSQHEPNRNRIGDVRIDFGGIHNGKQKSIPVSQKINHYFNNHRTLNTDSYLNLLADSKLRCKAYINKMIALLPESQRFDCYIATMNHPDSKVRANVNLQLRHIPENQRFKAFWATMTNSNSDVRKGLGEQIGYLSPEEKKIIALQLLDSEDEGMAYGITSDMQWLIQHEQKNLFGQIFEKLFPTFRVEI